MRKGRSTTRYLVFQKRFNKVLLQVKRNVSDCLAQQSQFKAFLQRRHADGQKSHEEMFNITSYQRNANQNYLILVRRVTIKEYTNNKWWRGCEEKGTPLHCWWECKLLQPLWRTVWMFLKKKKNLPYDPAISFLGIYPNKNVIQKDSTPQCSLQHYL